jgi:PBSX family phage terminase large subunit
MMKDPKANCVAMRKIRDTCKDSIYAQFLWAIEALGVSEFWKATVSPMELTYIPTGQKIIFRGLDSPLKLKSIKFSKGYAKYCWFEELAEFAGMEEIRSITQSIMRGGEEFVAFYSYNPPRNKSAWVNSEKMIKRPDRLVHESTYLTVPRDWLGKAFLFEAEQLAKTNEKAYQHEYLGIPVGIGGEIFQNVMIRTISDVEIESFDKIRRGIDFGYSIDPVHYMECHFDRKNKRLFIFYEIHKVGMSNRKLARAIKVQNPDNCEIIADSAEGKSIAQLNEEYQMNVLPCKKGKDSVDFGVKFLQDLEEIIIDDDRCQNTAREFLNYEYDKDREGNWKAKFPDKNNHSIDTARYAINDEMRYDTGAIDGELIDDIDESFLEESEWNM